MFLIAIILKINSTNINNNSKEKKKKLSLNLSSQMIQRRKQIPGERGRPVARD